MKNKIVSYNIAKLLCEKGFKEKTLYSVLPNGEITEIKSENSFFAPTLSEASDWLYDKYGIFIEIDYVFQHFSLEPKRFKFSVIDTSNDDFGGDVIARSRNSYETKYEALKSAINNILGRIEPMLIKEDEKSTIFFDEIKKYSEN